jgi:hypothetical protein
VILSEMTFERGVTGFKPLKVVENLLFPRKTGSGTLGVEL